MKLRQIQPTGESRAFAVWLMPDGTFHTAKVSQTDYDDFAVTRQGVGEIAGKPHADAVFCLAAGGMRAVDTPDGYPSVGDCWVEDDPQFGTVLRVCTGEGFDWSYRRAVADDPGDGHESPVSGFMARSSGNITTIVDYDKADPTRTHIPHVVPSVTRTDIADVVPNHHSVTFDAQNSGTASGTSLTVAVTRSTSANGYIAGLAATSSTVSGMTYAGSALSSVTSQASGNGRIAYFYKKVNPATGTNNLVVSISGSPNNILGGGVSFYGVDQTTPEGSIATPTTGNSTAPSITVTSATGDMVLTFEVASQATTNTVDATWTSDFVLTNDTNGTVSCAAAHKSGAASVTRTDSLNAVKQWAMLGVSIKASSAGPTTSDVTDTASGTETRSFAGSETTADTATASETQTRTATAATLADTASASEGQSFTATSTTADTAAGAETRSNAATTLNADTAAAGEASSLAASLSASETPTVTEGNSTSSSGSTQNCDVSDSATVSEGRGFNVGLAIGDTATGSELQTGAANFTDGDIASIAETMTGSLVVTMSVASVVIDSGTYNAILPATLGVITISDRSANPLTASLYSGITTANASPWSVTITTASGITTSEQAATILTTTDRSN